MPARLLRRPRSEMAVTSALSSFDAEHAREHGVATSSRSRRAPPPAHPSRNTRARWQCVTISSISVESTTMATSALVARSSKARVEGQARGVVDAARGVVEQHDARLGLEQPCQQHLLLVAAAQAGDRCATGRRARCRAFAMPREAPRGAPVAAEARSGSTAPRVSMRKLSRIESEGKMPSVLRSWGR